MTQFLYGINMQERLKKIFEVIDRENNQDPNIEIYKNEEYKKEYLYGLRMSEQLKEFNPITSEILKIACRAHHIRRWDIKRDAYAEGKIGNQKWRKDQIQHHADVTGNLMTDHGYSNQEIESLKKILLRKNPTHPDSQCLEDVASLVFFKYYFADFLKTQSSEKLKQFIIKTWDKMSRDAQKNALKYNFPPEQLSLLKDALEF